SAAAAGTTTNKFSTVDGSKVVDIAPSNTGSGLLAAGGVVSAVGSSWTAACEARSAANAEDNLTIPPPIAPPPVARSQWVNGVDNTVVLAAGAAVLLGGAFLMRR